MEVEKERELLATGQQFLIKAILSNAHTIPEIQQKCYKYLPNKLTTSREVF